MGVRRHKPRGDVRARRVFGELYQHLRDIHGVSPRVLAGKSEAAELSVFHDELHVWWPLRDAHHG